LTKESEAHVLEETALTDEEKRGLDEYETSQDEA